MESLAARRSCTVWLYSRWSACRPIEDSLATCQRRLGATSDVTGRQATIIYLSDVAERHAAATGSSFSLDNSGQQQQQQKVFNLQFSVVVVRAVSIVQ